MKSAIVAMCLVYPALHAQEAAAGFELNASISATASMPAQDAHIVVGEQRSLLYPSLKLSSHWSAAATIQSRVQLSHAIPGERTHTDVLQAYISYARVWSNGSFAVRFGKL